MIGLSRFGLIVLSLIDFGLSCCFANVLQVTICYIIIEVHASNSRLCCQLLGKLENAFKPGIQRFENVTQQRAKNYLLNCLTKN